MSKSATTTSAHEPVLSREQVLGAADLTVLASRCGVELRQSGRVWWAPCPFHAEKSASFKIELRGNGWRYKCFGCGAGGDAIDFWMRLHEGVTFPEALEQVGEVFGIYGKAVSPEMRDRLEAKRRAMLRRQEQARHEAEMQEQAAKASLMLPPLRRLSEGTMAELAERRGVSVEAVRAASDAGMVWGGEFGIGRYWGGSGSRLLWGNKMREEEERGRLAVGPVRCWIACEGACHNTEPGGAATRAGAAVRRLDGEPWRRQDGGEFKSWSVGTKKCPLGVWSMGERPFVMLVEGEGDLLAAYHFLTKHPEGADLARRHHPGNTAVVCVLGASSSVPEPVWPLFEGKRVRMFPDFDEEKGGKRSGWEAARKWQESLTKAGAEVDTFWLGSDDESVKPLQRADGAVVKDLGDAARGDAECLEVMEECFGSLWSRRGGENGVGVGVTGMLARMEWMAVGRSTRDQISSTREEPNNEF